MADMTGTRAPAGARRPVRHALVQFPLRSTRLRVA